MQYLHIYIQLAAFIYTYSYVHQLKPKEATETSSHGRDSGPRGIPKNISQAHGYDARRPDGFDKPATKRAAALFFLSKGLLGFHLKRALVTDICTKSHIWQTKINFKSQIWPLLAKAIFWPHLTFLTIPMSMQLLVKSFLLSILYPCK